MCYVSVSGCTRLASITFFNTMVLHEAINTKINLMNLECLMPVPCAKGCSSLDEVHQGN